MDALSSLSGLATMLGSIWQPATYPQLVGAAVLWAVLGIVLLIFGYKLFDWVLGKVQFDEELNKGNVAVAIVAAALIIAIAIIIHAAIN